MWSNISKRANIAIWASCYWVMSLRAYALHKFKAMYSYIPNPCGTPSVFFARFFQVVSPQVISFPSGTSQCGANKVERNNDPRRYAMIKRLQEISTSGNVTRTHLSYLLSFKLPPYMICSKLPCLTNVCSCALDFHTIILCTHLGAA
jgi:hypothetical protein